MRRGRTRIAAVALATIAGGCSPAAPTALVGRAVGSAPEDPPAWCDAVEAALGTAAWTGFRCLPTPGAVGAGFFGPEQNPDRSDFARSCFGSSGSAHLETTTRPAGDFRLAYAEKRALGGGGRLDLAFLGPFAPSVEVEARAAKTVEIAVELRDAEVRVLSSVGEILAQRYAAEDAGPIRDSLEACISTLCDPRGDDLYYAAKLLAAVPAISVSRRRSERERGEIRLLGTLAGFESRRTDHAGFELVGRTKLDIAALLEPARPALERAGACDGVRVAKVRRAIVDELRDAGLAIAHARALEDARERLVRIRDALSTPTTSAAFADAERSLVARLIEVATSAARDDGAPAAHVCDALATLHEAATSAAGRLAPLVVDLGDPLARRLIALANASALPCAEPEWYRDADGDGFGERAPSLRSFVAPDAHVTNALDCFDRNPDAHPGQRDHFAEHRGDGTFDYDCDGAESREDELVSPGCQESTRLGVPIRCFAVPGWQETVPPCGARGRWFGGCELELYACEPTGEEVRVERCR